MENKEVLNGEVVTNDKRVGKWLYTNDWMYEAYVAITQEMSSKRVSFDFYTISPDGEMSDIISVKRSDIFGKANSLDFFIDMDGDFSRDDVLNIKGALTDLLFDNKKYRMDVQAKATMEEIHKAISKYMLIHEEDLGEGSAKIFVLGNYGYMLTTEMEEFMKVYKEKLGFKRVEVLKRLKIMGKLDVGKNRSYDIQVSINGRKLKYYKILLAEIDMKEEDADETINVAPKKKDEMKGEITLCA